MLGLVLPMVAFAQTDVALDPEFGGRVSLRLDKRIVKGLHVSLEEEVRFDNNFGSLDRLQTTLALSYKVHPNIKLGLGYALINGYGSNSESFKNPRHRFMADVTGMLHFGNWNLSLKERFQVTCRTGDFNIYQTPQNALTLKSRVKQLLECTCHCGSLRWQCLCHLERLLRGKRDGLVPDGLQRRLCQSFARVIGNGY